MSNYLNQYNNSYEILSNINSLNFRDKSVLILGAGWMGKQYANALSEMNVKDVTIFSRSKQRAIELSNEFDYLPSFGDPSESLSNIPKKDLTIVATPIHSLIDMTKIAIKNGGKCRKIERVEQST